MVIKSSDLTLIFSPTSARAAPYIGEEVVSIARGWRGIGHRGFFYHCLAFLYVPQFIAVASAHAGLGGEGEEGEERNR